MLTALDLSSASGTSFWRCPRGQGGRRGLSQVKPQNGLIGKDHNASDVKDLLRKILACITDHEKSDGRQDAHEASKEVVFEMRVDGACYVLLRSDPEIEPPQPPISLSPREQEIARLVTKGLPNKAIAAVLDISQWTVATHLRRVYSKLGVNCRAEMVARVLQDNLVDSIH